MKKSKTILNGGHTESATKIFTHGRIMKSTRAMSRVFSYILVNFVLLLAVVSTGYGNTVSVRESNGAAGEGGPSSQFRVELNPTRASDTIVYFNVDGSAAMAPQGTAVNNDDGYDYSYIGESVTIAGGSQYGYVDVFGIRDDSVVEGDETIILTVTGTNQSDTVSSTSDHGTVIITDNDNYTINISSPVSTVMSEGGGTLTYTVELSNQVAASVDVDYAITGIDSGDISEGLTGTLSFAAGEISKAVTLTPLVDNIVEADEVFTITIDNFQSTPPPTNSSDSATGTITNIDKYPVFIYGGTDPSRRDRTGWGMGESHDMPFTIYIAQEPLAGDDVTVSYSTQDGTANAGQDYTAHTGDTVTFTSGGPQDLPINIFIVEDALVEPDEQFTVTLDTPSVGANYYIVNGRETVTGTIQSDDYVITYTATDGGSITYGSLSPDPCGNPQAPASLPGPGSNELSVDNDKCQDFVITVNADHELQDVLIDGVSAGSDYQNQPSGTDYTYRFPHWEPNKTPRTIEAIFKHRIAMQSGPEGVLSTSAGGGASAPTDAAVLVNHESTPTFTATSTDTCYHIDEFKVDDEVIADPDSHADVNEYTSHIYTFAQVTIDHTVSVTYAINQYEITTRILGEHGQLTADSTDSTVNCGSSAHVFTATAESGYHITWLKVYDENDNVIQEETAAHGEETHTITLDNVTQARVVEAAFTQKIEVKEVSPFGTIFPDGGTEKPALVEVDYNDTPSFQVDALDPCPDGLTHNGHQHHISDILVDNSSIGGVTGQNLPTVTHGFAPVIENHSIEALFTSYVDVGITGPGTVESGSFTLNNASTGLVEDSMEVESGDDAVFTITPATGYHVAKLEIDGVVTGYASSWTFANMVDEDHTLKVWFETDTFTLEPVSNFKTIFSDAALTTQAEAIGVEYNQNHTFYVELVEPNNYDYTITVAGLLVDNIQYDIPTATGTVVSKPDTDPYFTMERKTLNNPTDADYKEYLEVIFTNVKTSHRLEVLDYDKTPLADVPLDTRIRPQPAVIMFVLDDSGSMDWEFMTEDGGGLFHWKYYLWNIDDKLYSGHVLDTDEQREWKSQWSGYNKMYYNPMVTYAPWPTFYGSQLEDADGDVTDHVANANLDNPRSNPWYQGHTLDMNETWSNFVPYNVVSSDEQERTLANNGSHYSETITINNDHSRLHIWTTYTNSNLDTMARVFVGNSVDNGNEYRWDEYTSQHTWSEGHYDDDSGAGTNANIDLEDVPAGDYTIDITAYNGGSHGTFDLHVEVLELQYSATAPDIVNAHYFAKDNDDNLYLINIKDPVEYYLVSSSAGDAVEYTDLTKITDLSTIPAEVIYYSPANYQETPDSDDLHEVYLKERQNFVNWFSYYRKRTLSSTAAVATFIKRVDNVKIGFNSINHDLVHAPEPVDVVENMEVKNKRKDLLTALYSMPRVAHNTPLRRGLDEVGKFYDATDNSNGGIGPSPFADGEDGSECKQVFSIVMTDGYWNGAAPEYSGYPLNIPDEDSDGWSPTLADVAMHYYEMDMSDLPNKVPDEGNSGQHMVTYTVAFGVKGHLDPAVDQAPAMNSSDWYAPNHDNASRIDDLWHAAVNGRGKYMSASRPDKLVASLLYIMEDIMGGRVGSGASVAINGDELFETIGEDIRIFQSSYDSDYWTGDVRAFLFDTDNDGNFTGNRTQEWSAQARLSSAMSADGSNHATARRIVTWNPGTVSSTGVWTGKGGIALKDTELTTEQEKYLSDYFRGTATCTAETTYGWLLDYLRGDRRALSCGYRERKKTLTSFNHTTQEIIHDNDNLEEAWLGDFVDSKPVYADGVLYAGANDGMLHAFKMTVGDSDNGKELFAYMPNLVFYHVRELADTAYSHKFFVNGTPVIKKIKTGSTDQYYLVGGLGKGGKGYYCLNITDAKNVLSESDARALVQWEYPAPVPDTKILSGANRFTFTAGTGTNGDDRIEDASGGLGVLAAGDYMTVIGTADYTREITNDGTYKVTAVATDGTWIDIASGSLISGCGNLQDVIIRKSISDTGMGYSYGTPIIVETNAKTGDPGHGYVVIVANGYASEKGTASLKIINLTTGKLIKTIDTERGPFNGLSSPRAIDVDNDLKVDYVYAGDLLGNVWKFDLTSEESANWQVAFCENPDADHCKTITSTNLAEPLFTTSAHQPVTGAPDIMRHKDSYGYMVIFGTGRYLGMTDLANTDIQSIYGIWDWAPDNWDKGYIGTRIDNVTVDPHVAELSNWTVVDVGGKKINTLLRQEIWCEGILKEDLNSDGDTNDADETLGYYRIPSNYKGDWTTQKTSELDSSHPLYNKDLDGDGEIDKWDKVPFANLGWYFDLPGKISGNPAFSCTHADNVARDLGERVTSDAVIRDGRAILISFMKEGDRCTGGLYSFINERDADNGGMPYKSVIDVNGDGQVDEEDLVEISVDVDGDGNPDSFPGVPTDKGYGGHLYGPVILQDKNGDGTTPEETKYFSSSTEKIEKIKETAERRGVYFWQQVE